MITRTEKDMQGKETTYHIGCPLTTGDPAIVSGGHNFIDGLSRCIGCNQAVEESYRVSKVTPAMPQGGHDEEVLIGTRDEVETDYRAHHEWDGELCIEEA